MAAARKLYKIRRGYWVYLTITHLSRSQAHLETSDGLKCLVRAYATTQNEVQENVQITAQGIAQLYQKLEERTHILTQEEMNINQMGNNVDNLLLQGVAKMNGVGRQVTPGEIEFRKLPESENGKFGQLGGNYASELNKLDVLFRD